MAIPYQILRDVQGFPTTGEQTGRAFANLFHQVELTASTAQSITVPVNSSNKMIACIAVTPNGNVFMTKNYGSAITVPTGTLTELPFELIPDVANRFVVGGDVLQFITASSDIFLSISYYELLMG